MICARLPRNPPPAAAVSVLHPSLNQLTEAWAMACATRADAAQIAATAPRMRAVSPASGDWVLQGLTSTGGAVCACITPGAALRIIATGPEGTACLHIPLADLARATA